MVVLTRHRAADDFEAIRARMDELRRELTEAVRGEPIASPSRLRRRPRAPAMQPIPILSMPAQIDQPARTRMK
jgi:hypothetical protein